MIERTKKMAAGESGGQGERLREIDNTDPPKQPMRQLRGDNRAQEKGPPGTSGPRLVSGTGFGIDAPKAIP